MFAVVQNGQVVKMVQPDQAFTVGDKQYSARFLRNSSLEEKKAAGVWEVIDSNRPDDRYYWVTGPEFRVNEVAEVVEAAYTSNPKALEDVTETPEGATEPVTTKGLKSNTIAQVKQTAGSLLAGTDWMVIRKAERNVDIPADVVTYRAGVVAECDRLESAIGAVTSTEELIAIQANWPVLGQ